MAPAMIASHSATSLDAHLLRRRNPIPASPAAASHALSAAAGRSCQLAGSRRSAAARPGGSSLLVRRFRENDTEVDLVTDVKVRGWRGGMKRTKGRAAVTLLCRAHGGMPNVWLLLAASSTTASIQPATASSWQCCSTG